MGSIRELKKSDGTSTFHAEVRLKGFPRQSESFRTRSQAKLWIQKTETAIRDGRQPVAANLCERTVGDVIRRYVQEVLPLHPQRQDKLTTQLKWWHDRYGKTPLNQFTSALICQARKELLEQPTSRGPQRNPSTVNRYLAALGAAFTAAVREWHWLESSPLRRVGKLKEGHGRDRYLNPGERNRLLEACRASRNPYLYSVVSIALITGMRQGEILQLRWEDIDLHFRTMKLRKTKNGDMRVVPITSEVLQILRDLRTQGLSEDDRVFPPKQNRLRQPDRINVRSAFETACREAGVANFRFHDLRHTAASYLAMSGATQGELMEILGHRSPCMTRRYAHYSQQHLQRLLEKNTIGFQPKDDHHDD